MTVESFGSGGRGDRGTRYPPPDPWGGDDRGPRTPPANDEPLLVSLRGKRRRIKLSMAPEEIEVGDEARTTTLALLLEDYDADAGMGRTEISWSGVLPGVERKRSAFVRGRFWEPPNQIAAQFRTWNRENAVVRLDIAGTPFSLDVRIVSFRQTFAGGHGDVGYTISLLEHRALRLDRKKRGGGDGGGGGDKDRKDEDKPGKKGDGKKGGSKGERYYTVKPGDSLWKIAVKFLGSGLRWREIWDKNKERIQKAGGSQNLLPVGVKLIIPKK